MSLVTSTFLPNTGVGDIMGKGAIPLCMSNFKSYIPPIKHYEVACELRVYRTFTLPSKPQVAMYFPLLEKQTLYTSSTWLSQVWCRCTGAWYVNLFNSDFQLSSCRGKQDPKYRKDNSLHKLSSCATRYQF